MLVLGIPPHIIIINDSDAKVEMVEDLIYLPNHELGFEDVPATLVHSKLPDVGSQDPE